MNWQQKDNIYKNNRASHLTKVYYAHFDNPGFSVTLRKVSYSFKIVMKFVNLHISMKEKVLFNFVRNAD